MCVALHAGARIRRDSQVLLRRRGYGHAATPRDSAPMSEKRWTVGAEVWLDCIHQFGEDFMRFPSSPFGVLMSLSALLWSPGALAQNQPPASTHVIIPNPTPRPPDLQQELENNSKERNDKKTLSLKGQLRAREIWLESNQILLLAQQLELEINSGKQNPAPISQDAAKVAQIEKLARSVQEKMKAH